MIILSSKDVICSRPEEEPAGWTGRAAAIAKVCLASAIHMYNPHFIPWELQIEDTSPEHKCLGMNL